MAKGLLDVLAWDANGDVICCLFAGCTAEVAAEHVERESVRTVDKERQAHKSQWTGAFTVVRSVGTGPHDPERAELVRAFVRAREEQAAGQAPVPVPTA